jgi:hypothetical protein
MASRIAYFDILGTKPTLFINGNHLHKTIVGGMLSIISFFAIFTGCIYFGIQLIERKNLTVMLNEASFSGNFMNMSNWEMAIRVGDKTGNNIPNAERIFNIVGTFWFSPTQSANFTQRIVQMEKCSIERNFQTNPNLWLQDIIVTNSYCVSPDELNDLYIQKTYSAFNYTGLVFWVTKCVNSTANSNKCLPQNQIDDSLSNLIIQTRFVDNYFDHNKLGDPTVKYIWALSSQASATVYKRVYHTFSNIEYRSDDGFLFTEEKIIKGNFYSGTSDSTDLRTNPTIPGAFYVISLNMSNMKRTIYRRYYKLQNVTADMGGIMKCILTVFTLINSIFSDASFYKKVIYHNLTHIMPTGNKENTATVYKKDIFPQQFKVKTESSAHVLNKADMVKSSQFYPQQNEKRSFKKIPITQYICLAFCLSQKQRIDKKNFEQYRMILKRQLDINHVISQTNIIDKISFMFSGNCNSSVFENGSNPYLQNYLATKEKINVKKNPFNTKDELVASMFDKLCNFIEENYRSSLMS